MRALAPRESWHKLTAKLARLNPFPPLLRKMADFALGLLTKPVAGYTLTIPNDMARLKRLIRKGDVILVEGNERISECIKYLTQSSWSHACLYVGDEPLKLEAEQASELIAKYGEEANYLVVEALVESGVVLSPLSKYKDFNIRVCRPYNLAKADLSELVDVALKDVGYTYDLKNVIDLARYFFPVTLVPPQFRRKA